MSDVDYERAIVDSFRGAWTYPDEPDVPNGRALIARNVRFPPGRVQSRDGHSPVFTSAAGVSLLHNWLNSDFNSLVYRDGNTVKIRFLDSGNTYTLFTLSGAGSVVAEAGLILFTSTFTATGLGAGQCRVTDASLFPSFTTDKAFPPRMSESPALADNGAGNCTKGTHKIAYVIETRSGGFSVPCPQPNDTFTPAEFEVTTGGRIIKATFQGAYPTDAAFIWLLMTPVSNTEAYYWVGNRTGVPGGESFEVNINIDISDEHLVQQTDATKQFSQLSRSITDDSGPFNPSVVMPYSKRMIYIADDEMYISDSEDYQNVSSDYHRLILPGRKRIITAFVQRGILYPVGPSWTYMLTDNDDYPSTWAQPESVDEGIGTPSPYGVTVSQHAREHAWVANQSGLWLFEGSYHEQPISYFQSDQWDRINWAYDYKVRVLDDHVRQRVIVLAPLDDAVKPSHELIWHYSMGRDVEAVDFTLNDYAKSGGTLYPGAVALVQDDATKKQRKWIAGIDASDAVLQEIGGSHSDDNAAIDSQYRTSLLPQVRKDQSNAIRKVHLRISGSGTADVSLVSRDELRDKPLYPVTLSAAPSKEAKRSAHGMKEEQVSIDVSNNTAGEWWSLSRATLLWQPYADKK